MTTICVCGDHTTKVIYLGLPGQLCLRCDRLTGMASYAPPVVTHTPEGPMFAYMTFEGSYWVALWYWLFGGGQ